MEGRGIIPNRSGLALRSSSDVSCPGPAPGCLSVFSVRSRLSRRGAVAQPSLLVRMRTRRMGTSRTEPCKVAIGFMRIFKQCKSVPCRRQVDLHQRGTNAATLRGKLLQWPCANRKATIVGSRMGQQSCSPIDLLREESIVVNLLGNYSPNHRPRDKCTTEAWKPAGPANKLGLRAIASFSHVVRNNAAVDFLLSRLGGR